MASDDERHGGEAPCSHGELLELQNLLRSGLALADRLVAERRTPADMRARGEGDGGPREALRALESRNRQLELVVQQLETRALSAEHDLSDMANAYVASSQLHVVQTPQRVLTQVNELLGQLVGAECFVVYLLDDDGRSARAVSFEGLPASDLAPVAVGSGVVGMALSSGEPSMRLETPLGHGSVQEPLAVVPLLVSGQAMGAVSVIRLLPQKTGWAPVDHELLQLVSQHAGVALLSSHLLRKQPDLLTALAGLGESLA